HHLRHLKVKQHAIGRWCEMAGAWQISNYLSVATEPLFTATWLRPSSPNYGREQRNVSAKRPPQLPSLSRKRSRLNALRSTTSGIASEAVVDAAHFPTPDLPRTRSHEYSPVPFGTAAFVPSGNHCLNWYLENQPLFFVNKLLVFVIIIIFPLHIPQFLTVIVNSIFISSAVLTTDDLYVLGPIFSLNAL